MPFQPAISPESSLDNFDFTSAVKNEAKIGNVDKVDDLAYQFLSIVSDKGQPAFIKCPADELALAVEIQRKMHKIGSGKVPEGKSKSRVGPNAFMHRMTGDIGRRQSIGKVITKAVEQNKQKIDS